MKFIIIYLISLTSMHFAGDSSHWAESAIWYQIFPDRFYNGDKNNDPDKSTLNDTWPYELQLEWEVMPWTDDWYKLQDWEKTNGEDFYYNAQLRRYGGDIQGIIDKLDYLEDLGITAIYLNPVFESPSAHKYGARFYHHIDNNFGPNPELDDAIWSQENPADPSTWLWTSADSLFLKLIGEVHNREMKIIIDGVFNHVGIPFWAFEDVKKNGEASEYAHWFIIHKWDDPLTEENEFDYEGWHGIKDLPVLRENEQGLIPPVKQHIQAVVKRWMDPDNDGDPSDGIDGWRLDVADQVNMEFWREFRIWVDEVNPNAYITGEIWWDDFWNNKMLNAEPWLKGDAFHGVMNYRLADALFKFMIDEENQISATEFKSYLETMISDYGFTAFLPVQNILGSHDTERLASSVVNPDRWIDHANNLQYNPEFKVRRPNVEERALQKMLVVFQFLFPGAPYIYYGDEVGMWGADDPDCRKPMLWEEFTYKAETAHPVGLEKGKDEVSPDLELKNFYKQMIQLRSKYKSLRKGIFTVILADDDKELFIFSRSFDTEKIIVIFNLSPKIQRMDLSGVNDLKSCRDIDSNDGVENINAKSYKIIECNEY
ncbi:MAG: glycoside hydrolase family 13 protein [Candidatus Marinimicrobia bacterium]|nr:glycoside hydrolase family 13 protein [Candidatus Neomarinimicrobiota bacterium]